MKNPYIKIARPDHWMKQLFIIPGIVIAIILVKDVTINTNLILKIILGFLGTCFIASSNYVINEYLDAEFDKYHPTKKNRPMVTENMNKKFVFLEYAILAILGLICAWFVSLPFFIVDVTLLLMGIIYNVKPIRTKDIAFLDALSESVNNALRLLLGWFIITNEYLPPLSIIGGYWMFGAFLMSMKRFAEYRMINDKKQAVLYRKSFAKYTEVSLLIASVFYALLSIFLCGTFLIKYRIELLICIPFLCALFCYYLYISFKSDSAVQKPEKLYKEKKLLIFLALFIILFIALLFIDIPALNKLLDVTLIKL